MKFHLSLIFKFKQRIIFFPVNLCCQPSHPGRWREGEGVDFVRHPHCVQLLLIQTRNIHGQLHYSLFTLIQYSAK